MDILNSQQLTYLDGYLHAFREPGIYTYRVLFLPRGYEGSEPDSAYTIEVGREGNEPGSGKQHDITLRWDASKRAYQPEPAQLSLGVNDYVLWHVTTTTVAIPPYSIRGAAEDRPAFDSRAMGQHDVFTHFFMTSGDYTYTISGRVEGRISVHDHREVDPSEYQKRTTEAPVVRIIQGKPEPERLEVFTGQTVVWVVEEGEQVTIAVKRATERSQAKPR